jgi:hypothetical protein
MRARGKKGGVIGCAMANRANRVAYALVRDQTDYDPPLDLTTRRALPRSLPTRHGAGDVHVQRPQRSEDERR